MTALDLSRVVWRKSARSGAQNNCVEVADLPDAIAVRDSKNPDGPKLAFTRREWEAFAAGVQSGRFGL